MRNIIFITVTIGKFFCWKCNTIYKIKTWNLMNLYPLPGIIFIDSPYLYNYMRHQFKEHLNIDSVSTYLDTSNFTHHIIFQ